MMNRVLGGLYIGDYKSSEDQDLLDKNGITHIVVAAAYIVPKWPKRVRSVSVPLPLRFSWFSPVSIIFSIVVMWFCNVVELLDVETENAFAHFDKCNKFIDSGRNNGAVLVHCQDGISRSATIVSAYLMYKIKVSVEDAVGLIHDARPVVQPNDGFMSQLHSYYLKLHPTVPAVTAATVEQNAAVSVEPAKSTQAVSKDAVTSTQHSPAITQAPTQVIPTETTPPLTAPIATPASTPTPKLVTNEPPESSNTAVAKVVELQTQHNNASETAPSITPAPISEAPTEVKTPVTADALASASTPIPPPSVPQLAPEVISNSDIPSATAATTMYMCKTCRHLLFTEDSVIAHAPITASRTDNKKKTFQHKKGANRLSTNTCTSYFITEQKWMPDLSELEGKLNCPHCHMRIGTFKWDGMQCSCSWWETPAFQIHKSKVDVKDPLNTVPVPRHSLS
ncbi:phosphatases II [Pelomyxa schiedti]|nr:phosphatases II [Pelomyxa schiedti]